MTCVGKTECEIYRDKKYCRAVDEKKDLNGACNCNHAVRTCDVGHCSLEGFCGMKDTTSLADLIPERKRTYGKEDV